MAKEEKDIAVNRQPIGYKNTVCQLKKRESERVLKVSQGIVVSRQTLLFNF